MIKKILGILFLFFGVSLEVIGYISLDSDGISIIFFGTFFIVLGISLIVIGDGEDGYRPKEKISKSFFDSESGENKWAIKLK